MICLFPLKHAALPDEAGAWLTVFVWPAEEVRKERKRSTKNDAVVRLASAIHESCLGQACLHLAALQASSGAGHRICVYLYWKSFKCASRRAGVGSMTLK